MTIFHEEVHLLHDCLVLHDCLCASSILVSSHIDSTQVSNVLKQFESRNEKEERESKKFGAVKKLKKLTVSRPKQ